MKPHRFQLYITKYNHLKHPKQAVIIVVKCSYWILLVVRDDIYNYIQKPTYMRHSISIAYLLLALLTLSGCAAIEKGFVTIEARTGDAS